jgi:hypothetical protein
MKLLKVNQLRGDMNTDKENSLGLLLYGFSAAEAGLLKEKTESFHESDIIFLSASEREEFTVKDILNMSEHSFGQALDERFIMFLGFHDDLIMKFMKSFPSNIRRPIFYGLTSSNIEWKVSYLMNHLIEEKRKFEKVSDD